ncbi:hypothetical protein [Micromonospora sp. NBC_01638]|nr:hypothetical protein OG811_11325 [Micromonospora sp. NBC_01638]
MSGVVTADVTAALDVAGLSTVPAADPLPGPPPAAGEFDWRWCRRE